MIEKIINLTSSLDQERKALDNGDPNLTLDEVVAHCAEYLKEFNELTVEERFHFLVSEKGGWNAYRVAIVIYAISHSYLVREPERISDETIDHLSVDGEPITIVTTPNGERLSFDNFPEFGEAHFSSYFPLHYEAALASKHIAMMCRGLGRIW